MTEWKTIAKEGRGNGAEECVHGRANVYKRR